MPPPPAAGEKAPRRCESTMGGLTCPRPAEFIIDATSCIRRHACCRQCKEQWLYRWQHEAGVMAFAHPIDTPTTEAQSC